ncbi:hypothetical protein IP93_00312 [Lysobacter ruishenii]|uniref:Uncharacterized protein n=2 Tax=Aerolutibacter ruishenii TaxID=686800 RepID=A0A562M302_9GAMM|nr:hypothetical protein IP93_00312 [Lysobacter ruishenii]
MLLAKTDKARTAIQNRDAGLTAQERHILIVSNGQRSLNDIVSMLGPAILASIDRLLRDGYLQPAAAERTVDGLASTSQGMHALLRASRDLASKVQERAHVVIEAATTAAAPPPTSFPAEPVATLPTPPAAPRVGPRRSLAAAKMYMLDMLQLQRSSEAASLKLAIQSSSSGEEILGSLIDSLRHLRDVATASYYDRVAMRLGEVLPEEFVPHLAAAMRVDTAASSAA